MFHTTSSAQQQTVARPSRFKTWLRFGAAFVTTTMVGTAALAGTVAPAHAAPVLLANYAAPDYLVADNLNTASLAAATAAVTAAAENRVLQVTATTDWHGLQIPGSYFTPGVEYRLSARVLNGSGTAQSRWVSATNANGSQWIGNTNINADAWTTVEGTFVARDSGVDQARLNRNSGGIFFVDNVLITRVSDGAVIYANDFQAGDTSFGGHGTFANVVDPLWTPPVVDPPADGGEDGDYDGGYDGGDDGSDYDAGYDDSDAPAVAAPVFPTIPGIVVQNSNLFNADGNWAYDFMPHGTRTYVGGAWRLGRSADWNGIFDTNEGSYHFPMVVGTTYAFQVAVRAASAAAVGTEIQLTGYPTGGHLATATLGADWTILTGELTAGAGQRFRVTSDDAAVEVLVHSARLIRVASGDQPGGDLPGGDQPGGDQPQGGNRVLRIEQTADWQGLQIPGHLFAGGGTYRVQARALDGGGVGNARFVSQTDGNNFAWIANTAINSGTWTTLSDTFVARTTGLDHVRLVGGSGGTFYVDDVVVTRIADGVVIYANDFTDGGTSFGGDGGTFTNVLDPRDGVAPPAPPARNVVWHLDFAAGTTAPWNMDSGTVSVTNGIATVAPNQGWGGLESPQGVMIPGAEYEVFARVRLAAGATGTANVRFWGLPGHNYINAHPGTPLTSEWAEVTGTWTALDGAHLRLASNNNVPFEVDEIIVTRIGNHRPGPDASNRENWIEIYHLDFESGFFGTWDADHGGTIANVVPNPFGEGNVLAITRYDDWHGLGSPVGLLSNGAQYFFEMDIRIAPGGPGTADAMFLGYPGWAHVGRTGMNNAGWTTVGGFWTPVNTGSTVRVVTSNIGDLTYGFYVSQITVWQTADAPEFDWIEPGTVVLSSNFDGANNARAYNQDGVLIGTWEVRDTTPNAPAPNLGYAYFSWIAGADGSSHGIAINNRDNQGDGPIINVADILEGGRRYRFRGYARFLDGTAGTVTLSSQTDGDSFTNLLTDITVGANWTPIAGAFTFPAFAGQAALYFETPWDGGAIGNISDFAFDQFEIYIPEELTWQRDLPRLFETLDIDTVGVAVDTRELTGGASELLLHHFNHIVGENHMKPEAWFAGQGMNTFRRHPQATAMLQFAQDNNITLFGHVLVWHSQHPGAWFFTDTGLPGGRTLDWRVPGDSDIMRARMRQFIGLVAADVSRDFGLFGSDTNPMNSWEVVNEVVAGNPNVATGMRENSPWFQAFGPGNGGFGSNFMIYAFEYADYYFNNVFHVDGVGRGSDFRASGDNRITLWINDYNTERGLDSFVGGNRVLNRNTKRYVLLNITNWLIDNGAPIDGVGHQFHAGLQWPVQGLADALAMFTYTNGHVNAPLLQAITEIDVTVPTPVTEAGLLAQGHYYYQAFEIIRRHQATYGDIDNVTIWGLTDNRSWRADQAPLLFDAYFQAKPAFFGAIMGGIGYNRGDAPDWDFDLDPVIRLADVFGAQVALTQAGYHAQIGLLPLLQFATGTGGFTTRWTADALYVLADLPVAPGDILAPGGNAGRRIGIEYAGLNFVVWPNGVVTNSVGQPVTLPGVSAFVADRAWIVRIAHTAYAGEQADLIVTSIEGSQQSPQAHTWDGQITFRENLSVTEVVLAAATPGFDSVIWDSAQEIRTSVNTAGSALGATATVRTVWRDGGAGFSYLYVLANINDTTPDHSATAQRHETDSFEVFISLGNNRGASYEHLYDLQARFHRNGEVDVNGTPAAVHYARVERTQVREVAGGYQVLAAIRLATDTGHQQGNWNSAFGNFGEAFGFDVQVNDARDGSRYSAMIWADPTGESWMSTYRWGVARLVNELGDLMPGLPGYPEHPGDDVPGDEPGDDVPGDDVPGDEPGDDGDGDSGTDVQWEQIFYDVYRYGTEHPARNRFYSYIHWLNANGLAAGWAAGPGQTLELPTFRPSNQMTREAMAAFLYRAAGSPEFALPDTPSFNDIADTTFELEIEWMYANGIAAGWADGSFRPGTAVTRGAMAAFLFRFHNSPEVALDGASFVDVPADSAQAGYIAWLAEFEIAQGWADGTFRPSAPITREAMAAFMHRAHTAASNGHFDLGNWNL